MLVADFPPDCEGMLTEKKKRKKIIKKEKTKTEEETYQICSAEIGLYIYLTSHVDR